MNKKFNIGLLICCAITTVISVVTLVKTKPQENNTEQLDTQYVL